MGFTVKFRFHPSRTHNFKLNPHAQQLKFNTLEIIFAFVFLGFFFFSEETEDHLENIPLFDPIHINFRPTLTALRVEFLISSLPSVIRTSSVYQQSNDLQMTVKKEFIKSLFQGKP